MLLIEKYSESLILKTTQ